MVTQIIERLTISLEFVRPLQVQVADEALHEYQVGQRGAGEFQITEVVVAGSVSANLVWGLPEPRPFLSA